MYDSQETRRRRYGEMHATLLATRRSILVHGREQRKGAPVCSVASVSARRSRLVSRGPKATALKIGLVEWLIAVNHGAT